jgi:NADH pyrophosphatase NudC (nudix superfamily)
MSYLVNIFLKKISFVEYQEWPTPTKHMVTFIVLIINYEFQKLKYVFVMEEMLKCMWRYNHLVSNARGNARALR